MPTVGGGRSVAYLSTSGCAILTVLSMASLTSFIAFAVTAVAAGTFLFSKLYFFANYRVGWFMVVANTIYDTGEKRWKLSRDSLDAILFIMSVLAAALAAGPWAALAFSVVLGLAWAVSLQIGLKWQADVPAVQDRRYPRVPMPVPRLAVFVRGPVLTRGPRKYELGDWPIGLAQQFELIVLNPTTVRPQLPLEVAIKSGSSALLVEVEEAPREAPEPGELVRMTFLVRATGPARDAEISIRVGHGDRDWVRVLRLNSAFDLRGAPVSGATITRWKHGCNAAFAWRGDHDLHDPSTFQSVHGLQLALGLARRFRMPTTVMLSSRLSLESDAHAEFCEHFGWDRRTSEMPTFIRFLREQVDASNEQDFPTSVDRPFAAEIGNHMHLHYGTHAAADPGNRWVSHVRSGAGTYPWMSRSPCSSFEEQRDNIVACAGSIRKHLGIETTCFAIPSDFYDADTARAAEAAGIEVGNDTDSTKFQRQFLFPPEHHPVGCERLVELTRMSPRDPVNASQLAMLKYWVGFARRNRRALVYLAHHHLLMYQGSACFALTAELLRFVVADCEGDVHSGTVTSLGRYWRDVLSDRTRCVCPVVDGNDVVVANRGTRDLAGIPVEIEFSGGRRMMRIVDVRAGAERRLLSDGKCLIAEAR